MITGDIPKLRFSPWFSGLGSIHLSILSRTAGTSEDTVCMDPVVNLWEGDEALESHLILHSPEMYVTKQL